MKHIAVLGTGTMGSGMARNLLKKGFTVSVYNRTRARAEALQDAGAKVASTPAEAVAGAHVVLSMLADDEASRETWIGARGALNAAEPGAILLECSTVSPIWIAELNEHATARGLHVLDAPVTGSRSQAENGELNFIVGGDAGTLAEVKPALDAMGKSAQLVGPLGSGARLKLINNFLCGVQVASLAEAMAWIERSGLDRDAALSFLKTGAPGSPLIGSISARMVQHAYEVNFLLPLMEKDLVYAQREAERFGIALRMAAAAEGRFADAVIAGLTDKDMSAVAEPIRSK